MRRAFARPPCIDSLAGQMAEDVPTERVCIHLHNADQSQSWLRSTLIDPIKLYERVAGQPKSRCAGRCLPGRQQEGIFVAENDGAPEGTAWAYANISVRQRDGY